MSSRLAQLALLDTLQIALALALGEPAAKNLQDSKDALAWQRQHTHNFPSEKPLPEPFLKEAPPENLQQ